MNDPSDISLDGKAVVITGGTTGIGRATAVRLARAGARVLIFGRSDSSLAEALAVVREASPTGAAHGVQADIMNPADIERVFAEADARLGGVDILINNAGVAEDDLEKGGWADWQATVTTNVLGPVACTHHALARLRRRKGGGAGGHIVIVGSMSADLRDPKSGVYSATKAAVQAFGESLRKAVNPEGIRVSVVEPGAVDTPMQGSDEAKRRKKVESGDMLEADDIARAVHYCLVQPPRCDVVFMQVRPIKQII